MKSPDRLFRLLKSLSPSERRYFSRFAQRHKKGSDHQYLALFQAILAQDQYDEAALKSQFAGTSFARNFSFPKSHLYHLVLRALQQYHYERSLASFFRSQQAKIELLFDRALYDQALSLLDRSLEKALRFERTWQVLESIRWKRRLVLKLQGQELGSALEDLHRMERHWMEKAQLESQVSLIHDQVLAALQAFRLKTVSGLPKEMQTARGDLESLLAGEQLGFLSRIIALTALAHTYHQEEDFTQVHRLYQEAAQCWQAQPWQIKVDPDRYLATQAAYLNSLALTKDFPQLLQSIGQLRKRTDLGPEGEARVFRLTYNLELFIYLNTGDFSRVQGIEAVVRQGLETHHAYLHPNVHLSLAHNLAMALWLAGLYGSALQWTHYILHFPETEFRRDIQDFAPLLEKVLFYELGHMEALESWFRSYQYQLKKERGVKVELENLLFHLLRDLLQEVQVKKQTQLRLQFLNELDAYLKLPGHSKTGLAELRRWVEKS